MRSELPAIVFDHISRHFRQFAAPFDRVREALHPAGKAFHTRLPVLSDVSFAIPRGETVAVLGANGAGKSTLLHIVSGLLEPSSGSVTVNGSVFGLLDLGGSFAPELTGRENVRFFHDVVLRGAGDWHERERIVQQFAEIGDAFDRPVRTYSSGMFMRLAFAAAISAEPDILLIDEVIAVGDVRFQQKCYRRIREMHAAGTTILLVTHNIEIVVSLCDRVLLLDQGGLVFDGNPTGGVDRYYQQFFQAPGRTATDVASGQLRYGSGGAHITRASLHESGGLETARVDRGAGVTVAMDVDFDRPMTAPHFGFSCSTSAGLRLYATTTALLNARPVAAAAGERRRVAFSFILSAAVRDVFLDLTVFELRDGTIDVLDARLAMLHITVVSSRYCEGVVDLNAAFAETNLGQCAP